MPAPELHWLPEAADWSQAHAAVSALAGDAARLTEARAALAALANTRLDFIRTTRVDRIAQRVLGASGGDAAIRLAVLGSATIEHLLPAIRVAGLRRGLTIATHAGDYGQYRQELTDPASGLHGFKPNVVLFALDARHLLGDAQAAAGREAADAQVERIAAGLVELWRLARARFGCQVIQQTLLPVFPALMGSNEPRLPGSPRHLVERLNARLHALAESEGADLLAIDARAAEDGLAAWHDTVLWHRAKQDIHPAAAPVYGDLVARLVAAGRGRSAKCLVLDLDNTLWGGVIGDDGLDGIVLGQGSALGEAFVAFQSYASDLSRRGIILAVCSKNDEANALLPFERHPDMVLRRSDIACFVANWQDKAANLRQIAHRLNIGLDALVFVDDNPAERAIVRRELPMVAVPEMPEDIALYPRCVADAGYFEALRLTEEDLQRGTLYQANQAREALAATTTDLPGYLRSLEMELRWQHFDRVGLARIVQLINKTNQFNLTTRRYTEAEVLAVMQDPAATSLQLRLIDRFGDNGIIGIVIGRLVPAPAGAGGNALLVDTWLMSCRVLGRQVEEATLNLVMQEAARLGAAQVIGEYRPTAKNAMVRAHYEKLGFAPLDAEGEGHEEDSTRWMLPVGDFRPLVTHMNVTEVERQ